MTSLTTSSSTMIRTQAARRWGGFYDRNTCRFGEETALRLKAPLNERVWFELAPLGGPQDAWYVRLLSGAPQTFE